MLEEPGFLEKVHSGLLNWINASPNLRQRWRETAPRSLRASPVIASLPSSFSRRVKLELTKAEKTGWFRRIPAELRATFWCSGNTVFHFIAFVTKNSQLYFEEAGRREQQLVIQLLLSRLPGLFQIYKTTNFSRAARSVNQSTNVFHHASHTPANTHYKLIACVARRFLLGAK